MMDKGNVKDRLIGEIEAYFTNNKDIFGDHVELLGTNSYENNELVNSIKIMIRGVNFSAFTIKFNTNDIKNMMVYTTESTLTSIILDELTNFDAEDDFYTNTYSSLDDYWLDFDTEELMDMVLEDDEVFTSIISELGRRYD